MLRNEIQSLGWIAPSRRLSDTLLRADQLASDQRHRDLTLEHVVLGLTDDTDAARVLEANGVDVARFRDYIARYVAAVDYRWPAENPAPPVPDATLKRIFDVASAAAETSGRNEMDGALIVAAIIGEGTSEAAAMLQQHGLHVDDDEPTSGRPAGDTTSALEPQPNLGSATAQRPPAGNDLSDVHRMLSSPIEPQPAPTVQQTPMLQRTRPKQRVSQSTTPPPKAIISEHTLQDQVLSNGANHLANGQTQALDQTRRAAQPHVGQKVQPPQYQIPNVASPASQAHVQAPSYGATQTRSAPPPQPLPVDVTPNQPAAPSSDVLPENTADTQPALATHSGEGFAQIDADILGEILPAKMRIGDSEIIEIRVLNSDIDLLTGQLEGRDVAHEGARLVSRCLSLRLRSSSGGFSIEPRSPEVQWIEAQTVITDEDATSWRWQITGHRQGKARVQLQASARTVSADGTVLETAMPEQTASIAVRRGFGARLKRTFFVLTLLAAGGAAGFLARPAYRMIESVLLG